MSVLWPSKYAKIRFGRALFRTPLGELLTTLPRPHSRLGKEHPSQHPTPLGTDLPSALAMHPPRSPARSTPMYLHLCASVTKLYNLVPVKGRWRSEAGKVTVWRRTGHVSQTLWFIHLRAQSSRKGDEPPPPPKLNFGRGPSLPLLPTQFVT